VFGEVVPTPVIAIPLCVLIAFIAHRGVTGLERLGAIIVPLTFLLLIVAVVRTMPRFASVSLGSGSGAITIGAAISAIVGTYIVGIIIQPDYGRFVRRPRNAALAAFLALAVTFPLILGLSAVPSLALEKPDLIAALIVLGIGLPAVALLLLGAWIDASACLYSGSLALAKLFPRFRLVYIVAGAGVVGTLLALLHAERHFMPFLQLLGVALPPVAAVQGVTALWPKGELAGSARPGQDPRVRLASLAAWAIGIAMGLAADRAGLSLTGIASLDSIVGAGATAIVARVLGRRKPARSVRAPAPETSS
jgi:cytosine permease